MHHVKSNTLPLDYSAGLNLQACLASFQSWMSTNKLKLNPDKLNPSFLGTNDSGANIFLCFYLNFSVSKLTQQNLLWILELNSTKISSSAHIYQQCAAHAYTISGICGIFAVTLILLAQNFLQLLLCPVISIVAIYFFMVSRTLIWPNFNVFRIDWRAL